MDFGTDQLQFPDGSITMKLLGFIKILGLGFIQKSSLTLPPDPVSVTQAIKRVNLQIKI